MVLEKKIFKNSQFIFTISLVLEKGATLHLNKIESPSPKDALCQVWLHEIGPVVLERIFKFLQCIFAILLLSPLEKGLGPSINKT